MTINKRMLDDGIKQHMVAMVKVAKPVCLQDAIDAARPRTADEDAMVEKSVTAAIAAMSEIMLLSVPTIVTELLAKRPKR